MTNTENKYIHAGDDIWKNGYIKFPAALFKNEKIKKMSSGAKVLYIALLSRLSLSEKNGWRDTDGNVYVYFTISDVTDYIGCCKEKAIKLFSELDEKTGTGLIRRKRNGFGKPASIYFNDVSYYDAQNKVKRFLSGKELTEENLKDNVKKDSYELDYAENQTSLSEKTEDGNFEKTNTCFLPDRICEVGETDSNYNNIKYINKKYINNNYNQSVISRDGKDGKVKDKKYYETLVKGNIGYNSLIGKIPMSRLDEFVNIISAILESKDKYIKVGGHMLEASDVKERFSNLDSDHIRYVYESFKNVTSSVHNVRSYIITALYRSCDSVSLWTDVERNNEC